MGGPHVSVIIQAIGLGCYTDDPSNRTLNEQVWKDQSDMTRTWCATNCTRLQYPLWGVEYGRECFCGHKLNPLGVLTNCTCMPCWGDTSECCGDSNQLDVFSVSLSTITQTITSSRSATSTSSFPSTPTSTNQSPSQTSSTKRVSSSSSSKTTATTATTSTMVSSQTNSTWTGESTSIHSSPPPGSASSTAPSHSLPWPGNSSTSAPGSTTNSGGSTPGTSQSGITLLPNPTNSSSIIISSSAMSGNASSSSVSTSHPTSRTLTTKKNTHTQSSTAPTDSTVTATAILPPTTEAPPSTSPPVSPTYSFPTVPSSPLPSSSSITSSAPSDAADVGLNKAIIAGAVIGGVAVLSVVGFGIWFLKKIRKQPEDDDISMVGMPREEDVPIGMRNGIRRVRGNND